MPSTITRRLGAALAASVAIAGASATGAAATPTPENGGCAAAFERLSARLAGPYIVPELIDVNGNANGWVCGFPLPDAARDAVCAKYGGPACELRDAGLPMYQFKDDDNPAGAQ